MTQGHSVGDIFLDARIDTSKAQEDLKKYQQFVEQTTGIKLNLDTKGAQTDLERVKADIAALKNMAGSDTAARLQASKLLGQEYKTQAEAVRLVTAEQNKAASAARAAAAQAQVTARLSAQQAAQEKRAHQQGIQGIENEVRAYRNLWQTRTISNDQVYREQARLKQQALEMALTVDKQSDAYRRLTQVAAAAQRTMDSSQGMNTPGGFGAGISQGITNALGQFGVTGDLISGLIRLMESRRAQAKNTAARIGEDTLAGLQQGLQSNQNGIRSAADAAADSVAKAIRESLDIHSPSRVTEYLGRMAGLGFVGGLRSMTDDVRRAALGLTGAATGGLGGGGNVGLGGFGSMAALPAVGIDPTQTAVAAAALAALNSELAQAAPAAAEVAEAESGASDAVAGLGESVTGAAEHVKGLRDAHAEQEEASRQAAVNEAQTAIAFAATAAALGAVAVAATASYKAAAQYERAMNSAGATTEATAADMDALSKATFDERLVKLGISATTAASGVEELGSEGLNTAQIIEGGLVNALTLAKAVGVDVGVASSVAAASTKAFGLESKELARVTDIVTTAVNGTSIRMEDFTQSIAQGGSVANQSGLDFLTFTSAISLMTDKAISASDAGTSLKTFLQALTPNSKEATAVMDDLGFSAFTADGQFKSLSQIVGELREAFSKLTPEQRAVRAETVFGADGIRAFNILVNAGSEGLEERSRLLDKTGASTDAAAQKTKGALGAQEQFNAALENFKISAGSSFLPSATKMLDWSASFLTNMRAVNEEYGKFNRGLASFGAEEYNLPSWLKQTGLRESDLTGREKEIATRLLNTMQGQANIGAKNADQWRKLGSESQAQAVEARTVRLIGELGAQLIKIQAAASQRPRAEGPEFTPDAEPMDMSGIPAEAGKFGYAYISKLKDVFVNDPKVDSDCAVIASAILNNIGVKIKGSANAGILEKNAKAAGFEQVSGDEIRPGDLIVWTSGNGKKYGAVSGKHVGVAAGMKDGVMQVINNPGSSNTEVEAMYDKENATVYRAPTSAFDLEGNIKPESTLMGTDQSARKSEKALLAEARRILNALDTKSPDALAKAEAVLKAFEESGDRAKAALKIVREELGKAKKEVSDFGQGYDKLKDQMGNAESYYRLNDDASAYASSLEIISKNALAAAAAEKKKWGETKKYDALFALGGDAASKARQQREGIAREQDQDAKKQEAREKEAQQRAARVAEAARKGNEELAQQEAGRLEQMRENDLRRAGENAAAKLAIEKQYRDKTVKAQKDVADVVYKNAMGAAARGPAQNRAQAERIAKNALDAAYLKADTDAQARMDAAQKAADDKANARAKEQAALRAKYAAERRDLDVREAQATLTRTQDLNAQELKEFKGTQAQRVALIKRQAKDEFNAAEQAARAVRDKAIREAQNAKGPNESRNIQAANDAYADTVAKARNAQTNAGTQALEDQTKAVREARDGYSKLATGMREKIAAGKVELSDLIAYLVSMDQAADAAEKGGVSQQKYVKGARASAEAVYQAGIDAQIAAGMFADLGDGQSLAAEAGREYAVSLEDALAAMPGTIEGNAEYLKLLQDMAKAGQVAGGTVARISDLMRDQAIDAEIAAGKYDDVVDSYDRAARSAVKYVATHQDAIDQIPGGVEANAAYVKVLQDLEDAGKLAAGTVEAVSQAMRDQETAAAATAAQLDRLTTEAGKTADQYLELGDTDSALDTLQVALDSAMDAAMRGEDAAAAIAELIDRINELTGTTALNDSFNSFVAGLGGTIEEQITAVVDQMERVVDPKMLVKLRSFLADLRQGVTSYEDPSKAGYTPGSNGGGFTTGQPGGAETARAIAAARDFTTALNEELDPATLGTVMTQTADLLASEVGQALPAATRKGLEDGLKNAQAYQDALASITADGIQDGVSRTLDAPATPSNRFTEIMSSIQSGSYDLSDPDVLAGLNAGLEQARAAGELTGKELRLIQQIIAEINADPPTLALTDDQQRLEDWNSKLTKLEKSYAAGEIGAEEYVAQVKELVPVLERLAKAAELAGDPELASIYKQAADALGQMPDAATGAISKLGKFQEYAGYVRDLGHALAALDDGTQATDLIANLNGVANAAGKLADMAGDVVKIIANPADIKSWVALLTKVISSVADAIAGFRKAQAEVKKLKEDFQKDNPLLNAGDYQKTFVRSRGFFADVFGGGPEVVNEIDELGLTFAKTMASSFTDGIKGGLRDAIMNNDFSLFKSKLRETAFGGMLDGTLDLFLNEELLKNIIAPAIKAWSDAMKTPDTADDAAALAGLDTAINEVDRLAGKFYDDVAPKFQAIGAQYGITGPQDTRGVDTSNLSTLPEPIQFALATPLLDGVRGLKEAADVLKGAAQSIDETFKRPLEVRVTGPGTSYTSTTGAL